MIKKGNMIKKIFILVFAITIGLTSASAQSTPSIADKQYESGDFQAALQNYLKESNGTNYTFNTTTQIARCFDALGITHKAYKWYMTASAMDTNHQLSLELGKIQMKIGEYKQAKISFDQYRIINSELANHYLSSLENIPSIISNEGKILEATIVSNTQYNDYGASTINNNLYYNTDIQNAKLDVDARHTLADQKTSITVDATNTPLLKGIFTVSNISPFSVSENHTIAYSSYLSNNQSFASRRMNNTLYIGQFNKHKIENVKPFPYNKIGTSITDPYLSADGTTIYFSSDMEGGYGGWDLYYSQLENGEWTKPINLGEEINTPGNEITPNIDHNNHLYFASDYHPGLGGYDIFKAQWVFGGWMNTNNMGLGINSSNDDYYPFVDNNTDEIYFTSLRGVTNSGEDIYKAQLPRRDIVISFDGRPNVVSQKENITNTTLAASTSKAIIEDSSVETPTNAVVALAPKVAIIESSVKNTVVEGIMTPEQVSIEVAAIDIKNAITSPTFDEQKVYDEDLARSIEAFNVQLAMIEIDEVDIQVPEAIYIGNYQRRTALDEIAVITPSQSHKLNNDQIKDIKLVISPVVQHVPDSEVADLVPPPAFKIPDFGNSNSNALSQAHTVNYEGARLVSIGSVLKKEITAVYFIQLAAFYSSQGEMTKYEKLSNLGNIYKVFAGSAVKIRLGHFNDHNDAAGVLSRVKSLGYNDAFLVNDDLNTSNMELIYSNHNSVNTSSYSAPSTSYSTPSTESSEESSDNFSYTKPIEAPSSQEYKVRLASYEDPIWFESSKIKDLGQLEQWSKGSWTIFILSGYESYEDAEMARIKAVNRGYADAEVVIDNQGIIERLKKN